MAFEILHHSISNAVMKKEISKEAIAEISWLQKLAEKKGISYYRIAEMTGLQKSTVGRVLSGMFEPKLGTYLKIREAIEGK